MEIMVGESCLEGGEYAEPQILIQTTTLDPRIITLSFRTSGVSLK